MVPRKLVDFGCYTGMLRMVLNVTWRVQLTNEQLYQDLLKMTEKIQQRKMRVASQLKEESTREENI